MKKAMILAAGRGERLKPLTDTLPKPLLPAGSLSLIEHNIIKLKAVGVEEIVVNVCYRAKQIMEAVGNGERFGLKIHFSVETEKPLGTGGGVLQALRLLGDNPFILLSGDIWTDYPFAQLALSENKAAHLVMVENPDFHPKGDYTLLSSGLLDAQSTPKYTYANIAMVHPRLFEARSPGVFPLSPLFENWMEKQGITGELYKGAWFNVGTVEELQRLRKVIPG